MDNKQKEFSDLLELGPIFTLPELNAAYYRKARIFHPDLHPGEESKYWCSKMTEINIAYAYLKNIKQQEQKNKKVQPDDKASVFTTHCCKKIGLSLETAKRIYNKTIELGRKNSFDEWLRNRLDNLKKYEANKAEVAQLCKQSKLLSRVYFHHIVNLYECDKEFGGSDISFSNWLIDLLKICKESEQKLEEKNYFSIPNEMRNYIYSENSDNFIVYLRNELEIRELCQELNESVETARFNYDYNGGFTGTFREYLEYNVSIHRICNEMGMTKKESDEYYATYLRDGYKGTKLEFLREARAILPFSDILGQGYFLLKKKYTSIPKEERPENFVFWVELQAVTKILQCSPTQMLEKIYMNSKESGYDNSFQDLLVSLAGPHLTIPDNIDEFSNEEESEIKHAKAV